MTREEIARTHSPGGMITDATQTKILNDSFGNGRHEYLGNVSTPCPAQEQSFVRRNEAYKGFRAWYCEQVPNEISAADIPQISNHARPPPNGAFSAFPSSLDPPQGPQQMEIPNAGPRIEPVSTLRYSSPPRLSPRAQGWLNYCEALYFTNLNAMENDVRQRGLVPPSYGLLAWEQQAREFARAAFRQSFHQQLMRYGDDAWLEHVSILDHAKHSADITRQWLIKKQKVYMGVIRQWLHWPHHKAQARVDPVMI